VCGETRGRDQADRSRASRIAEYGSQVLRSFEIEFSYERDGQPLPKPGRFQAALDQLADGERGEAGS